MKPSPLKGKMYDKGMITLSRWTTEERIKSAVEYVKSKKDMAMNFSKTTEVIKVKDLIEAFEDISK